MKVFIIIWHYKSGYRYKIVFSFKSRKYTNSCINCDKWHGYKIYWASVIAQSVKNPPAMQETQIRSLSWEDPLEKKMATHSRILAWRIPWTEEPGGLQSIGSRRVRHGWAELVTLSLLVFRPPPGRTYRLWIPLEGTLRSAFNQGFLGQGDGDLMISSCDALHLTDFCI